MVDTNGEWVSRMTWRMLPLSQWVENDSVVSEAIKAHWIPSTNLVMPNFTSGTLALLSLSSYPCWLDNPHAIITAFPAKLANVLASTWPGHRSHLHQIPGEPFCDDSTTHNCDLH